MKAEHIFLVNGLNHLNVAQKIEKRGREGGREVNVRFTNNQNIHVAPQKVLS